MNLSKDERKYLREFYEKFPEHVEPYLSDNNNYTREDLHKIKIIQTILTKIPEWVDVNTGQVLKTVKTFPSDSTDQTPDHLREAWSDQAILLHQIVSSVVKGWSVEQYLAVKMAYSELEAKRRQLVELNRLKYRTRLNPTPGNSYINQLARKNYYESESLIKELEESYYPLAKHFDITEFKSPYDWSPVKPTQLTVTQFNKMPKTTQD